MSQPSPQLLETDDSTRHILPDDAPYLANLTALWSVDPHLAAQIDALDTPLYHTEPSRAGPPTVGIMGSRGAVVYLHSRYDPQSEARKLIEQTDLSNKVAYYVHGFGLGYHVEALFERAGDEALLCIFEPDVNLLRTAFFACDHSRLIGSGRVLFFTQADKSDLLNRLTPHSAMISVGVDSISHPPSLALAPDFHRQVQQWLAEYAAFVRTSLNTLVLNGRRTAENVSHNLGWYLATPSINRLAGRYAGKPAVIVSAGPSLRKNKHLLRDLADRAVIIAVQTTLKPLLDMGIEPHFVTSLDYHDICTRFYEKLPARLNTELVAEPKAAAAIFDLYPGPISLLGNEFAESLLGTRAPGKTILPGGATVAHLAFYLAEHLKCDPIMFVGQDLGFSDGLCYSPGTSYEDVWRPELGAFCSVEMKQWDQIVRERFILRRIPDYQGRPMYTEERLFTYLQQFERDFGKSQARVIDATEGGAAKRGATPMRLSEAIEQYCTELLPRTAADHSGVDWERAQLAIPALRIRRDEAAAIERISRETLPLLEQVRDALADQPRVNRLIAQIDSLRSQMNDLGACYDLITQLCQKSELARFEADRRLAAAKVDGAERQGRQVERDIQSVRNLISAAVEFQALMENVTAHVSSQLARGNDRDSRQQQKQQREAA